MTADRILTDTFAAHEHLAPDAEATLAEITRRLDDPHPARGRLAVVGAAAAVAAVAAGATLLVGDEPVSRDAIPAVSPTLTAPYPVDTLTVAPGWLPPGEVAPEHVSTGYGDQTRTYQITRRPGSVLHLAVRTAPGSRLPTRSHLETTARDRTVAGRPAREWSLPGQYYVVVALPRGRLASVSLHGDRGDTAAGLAGIGRRVAEQLRLDRAERVDTDYELTSVPAGRAVMSLDVTLMTGEGVVAGGTSYTVAAPSTTAAERKGQSIHVAQYNRSWRTMEFRPAPPVTTPGREVQGRPTLVVAGGGPTLWIDEIRPGVSIRLSTNAPGASLDDLYRIADGIRWTG